ncbi:MAG TPA: class I SAM-dependent methyltransferase [Polyangiaceae bacterium]|nr:class I SAM-dependent methyltransferase [Polyangiaceae bacterium]
MTRAPRDYYERYWRDGLLVDNTYERWKLERVRRHVAQAPRGARVLDVGCGDGAVLAALSPLGVRGRGLDVSEEAVARARARNVDAAQADLDGAPLPVGAGSADVVLCLDVLEHLFAPDRLLAEMRRALAAGGRLVVAVPNGLNLFNRLAFLSGRHVDIMDKAHLDGARFSEHLRFFSRQVLEQALGAAGFRPTARDYFFPERFGDARFRFIPGLAQLVARPRLHERMPSMFALAFLFACEPT